MKKLNLCVLCAGLAIAVAALLAAPGTLSANQAKLTKSLLKPDLQVHSITAEKIGVTPAGDHKVKITVQVKNVARYKNCAGPFKIKLERAAYPLGNYSFYRDAGVAKCCADPTSMKLRTETRYFEDVVPANKARRYRATVDFLDQVDEGSKEDNNEAATVYNKGAGSMMRRDLYAKVDLVLRRVELKRDSNGVFIRAHVKNMTEFGCKGSIVIKITEEGALGGGYVTQPIGVPSIEPNGEYFNVWVGVRSSDTETSRYTVQAILKCGIFRERNTSNNSCRVSLAAGDNYESVNCH